MNIIVLGYSFFIAIRSYQENNLALLYSLKFFLLTLYLCKNISLITALF